ncbi:MAG: class I SAM-dependent methyltransferase [Candidatus Acidiferrales bacterium]
MKIRGVDLRWASLEECGLSAERSYRYSDSGGPDLQELLDTLKISPSDEILDLGCGKGGALITLAKYPFAQVDGVEISPELSDIARANMKKLQISNSTIYCSDAAQFHSLDSYSHFYMYNPFPQSVTQRVLENIQSSLRRRPRRAILIYKNAVFHKLVLDAGFRKISGTQNIHPDYPPFSVYATESAARASQPERHVGA